MKTIQIFFATAFIAILSMSTTYAAKMPFDDVIISNSSTSISLSISNSSTFISLIATLKSA